MPAGTQAERLQSRALLPATEAAGEGAAAFSDLCSLATAPLPAQDREFDCADQSGGEIKAVRQGQNPA